MTSTFMLVGLLTVLVAGFSEDSAGKPHAGLVVIAGSVLAVGGLLGAVWRLVAGV